MRCLILIVATLLVPNPLSRLNADEPQIGEPAHQYIAVHFACGYWRRKSEKHICPVVNEVGDTKVAIYVKAMNNKTLHLAVALDRMLKKHPQLRRSFFIVSEEGRKSSMTEEELGQRLLELQRIRKEKGITELSLGFLQFETAPTRWRNSLGFFNSKDVIIVLIEPGISAPSRNRGLMLRTVKPFYRFVAALTESEIDEDSARTAISQALSSLTE